MINQFIAGDHSRFAIVTNGHKSIIIETDFCHWIEDSNGFTELPLPGRATDTRAVKDLLAIATPVTSMREFGHYWGIKGRVAINYRELLKSMRELGIPTGDMPEWGKEVAK